MRKAPVWQSNGISNNLFETDAPDATLHFHAAAAAAARGSRFALCLSGNFMLADDEKWFRVSLRFAGDSLPVDALESRLGIRPSSIGRKGEHIDGNQARAKFQTNVWTFCVDTNSSIPFEKQMDPLVNMLESKREALFELLTLPQIEADLLLGFSSGNGQGGASLSNTLLGRIAKLGLSISLDLYPPNCDEHLTGWEDR